jgi:uncharacterized protein (TIGR03083 family)
MPDRTDWINATRASHNRLAALLSPLDGDDVRAPSYASEWSIADVASHLGSQAEIFDRFLSAGLAGSPAPSGEQFGPIWDRWNALPPAEQVAESIAANGAFVQRLEQTPPTEADGFALEAFGQRFDFAGMVAMRLGEHALHAWDIAVALDPAATVQAEAVALLIDTVGQTAARAKPVEGIGPIAIDTTDPDRRLELSLHPAVSLAERPEPAPETLQLPAEALIRLVYGRLDPAHTPATVAEDTRLVQLRGAFPGF